MQAEFGSDPTTPCGKNVPHGPDMLHASGNSCLGGPLLFACRKMEEPRDPTRPKDDHTERLGLEPGDYYLSPEGYIIFTEQYHRKRGYCCGNACRHCPFGHEAVKKVQG